MKQEYRNFGAVRQLWNPAQMPICQALTSDRTKLTIILIVKSLSPYLC
jgi:hypothetical protein